MKTISLANGKGTVLVDDTDFTKLASTRWCLSEGYAAAWISGKMQRMHRLIAGAEQGVEVDHINGNRLDNRRFNLRISSRSQNCANTRVRVSNTTGYKGVTWDKRRGKFMAQIKVNYKNHGLGYFDDPEEAAKAYDAAAKERFGEFAKTNF